MRRIKSQIEEERILLVSLDEIDGIIGRNICVVLDVLIVLICLDMDELVVVETVVWIIVRWIGFYRTDQPSVELVKATIDRWWFRIIPIQMPFVDKAGFVTGCVQYRSDGCILWLQTCSANDGRIAIRVDFQTSQSSGSTHIITDTAVSGILTSHQRTSWWWTDSWTGIALVESCTRSSQFVNVGRLDSLAAVAGKIAISQIIGKDENDIGSVILQK